MLVTLGWLKNFVEVDLSPEEVGHVLTMAGLELDGIERPGEKLAGLRVAKVLSAKTHPGADNLSLCEVDGGDGVAQVVCGAPNVRAGLVTAYAPAGVTLPGGMKVKEAKIRGEQSLGMLCSERELGVGDDHSGILELPEDLEAGADLAAATMLDDTVFEFSVTSNRGDLLSVIGIARDLAAILGVRVRPPKYRLQQVGGKVDDFMKVDIHAPEFCPRYTGMAVTGVKIGPSPLWMSSRLRMVGIRPINNIVDITNYILMEWGQPLHAFDMDRLGARHIAVRTARDQEKMVTLDGTEHTLTTDHLLICDGEVPVALAGVMGGANSEVQPETTDIFIESAYFDPVNIRRTSASLGLSTESSYRFERGVDPDGVVLALHGAATLMSELGGGRIVQGHIDNYPKPIPRNEANLRVSRTNQVLGLSLNARRINEILLGLGMEVQPVNEDLFKVTVPPYRGEVFREVDLIEEIARIEGYEKIPTTIPRMTLSTAPRNRFLDFRLAAKRTMIALGFQEVLNAGLDRPERLSRYDGGDADYITLHNPATEDVSVMRTSLTAGLVKNFKHNVNFGHHDVLLFEQRPVFEKKNGTPSQTYHLAALISGNVEPASWNRPAQKADFYYLKGALEALLSALDIEDWSLEPAAPPHLHPGKSAALIAGGKPAGLIGALHPDRVSELDVSVEPFVFELDIDHLHKLLVSHTKYVPESRFPPVFRDLAVIVDRGLPAGDVLSTILREKADILEDVRLFDVYEGDRIEQGKKSLAFSLRYRSSERSLTDEEVGLVHDRIVGAIEKHCGARLRG